LDNFLRFKILAILSFADQISVDLDIDISCASSIFFSRSQTIFFFLFEFFIQNFFEINFSPAIACLRYSRNPADTL